MADGGYYVLAHIPIPDIGEKRVLAQVVNIKSVLGPREIKGEHSLFVGCVAMNAHERDEVSVVEESEALLQAVSFSAVGAILFLHLLGYNMSVAVWVGLIALLGVDAETGVFMLLYLDLAYDKVKQGLMKTKGELREAIVDGAVKRLRPKFMTVAVMFMSLVPIMWSTGSGADVMKRIAAPMTGGIFTSFIMEFLVYPAIYELWRWHFYVKKEAA